MTPPRLPTRPEGIPFVTRDPNRLSTNPGGYDLTPPPVLAEPPAPPAPPSWKPAATAAFLSVILGIVLGIGGIIAVLGKAFYVERTEYTQKVLRDAEERVSTQRALEQISAAMSRQEAALARLSDTVQSTKETVQRLDSGRKR